MITQFTPWASLIGGLLIGLSAVLFMKFFGKIAGMTGILSGLIPQFTTDGLKLAEDWQIRLCFLVGAVCAPVLIILFGGAIPFTVPHSTPVLAIGGLVVGIGVYFGSGCTSGHGVCGIARFSKRSIMATLCFMASTFVTVFVIRHVIGA